LPIEWLQQAVQSVQESHTRGAWANDGAPGARWAAHSAPSVCVWHARMRRQGGGVDTQVRGTAST